MTPAPVQFSREQVIEAALELARQGGMDVVSARTVAARLGSSTKPVFTWFDGMGDLLDAVAERINVLFGEHLFHYGETHRIANQFLAIGLGYIDFARQERNLFQILFMSGNVEIESLAALVHPEAHQEFIAALAACVKGAPKYESSYADLFRDIWLYVHGIASMIACNDLDLTDDEITAHLTGAMHAFSNHYLKGAS